MEKLTVSLHEVKVYLALKSATSWLTNIELAAAAGISSRTARAHSLKLVKNGIADQAELFPGYRYQLSKNAGKRNRDYLHRLEQAKEIFGL